jgi:hypothetical protein
MATINVEPGIAASGSGAARQRLDECLRALEACGRERLAPLAQHMANARLVRGRGAAGAPLRRLDVQVLHKALSRMLCYEWEDGYLIYQLVVAGMEPAQVAAERGVSWPVLVEQLRGAVGTLASRYECLANGHWHEDPVLNLTPAPPHIRPGRASRPRTQGHKKDAARCRAAQEAHA